MKFSMQELYDWADPHELDDNMFMAKVVALLIFKDYEISQAVFMNADDVVLFSGSLIEYQQMRFEDWSESIEGIIDNLTTLKSYEQSYYRGMDGEMNKLLLKDCLTMVDFEKYCSFYLLNNMYEFLYNGETYVVEHLPSYTSMLERK
jgi:hypothetical protein